MAEEEVDWEDDLGLGAQPGNGIAKDEDDAISLDGNDAVVEATGKNESSRSNSNQPPSGPRKGADEQKPQSNSENAAAAEGNDNNGGSSPLPPGWTAIMSKSHNRHFFYHKETNTTVWDKPSVSTNKEGKDDPSSPPLITEDVKPKDDSNTRSANTGDNKDQRVRGIETKPHYDKYWAQRDQSYQAQTQAHHQANQEKRRPRESSPPSGYRNNNYNNDRYNNNQGDREYKRFKGGDEPRSGNNFRRQESYNAKYDNNRGQEKDFPKPLAQTPVVQSDDVRTKPYNGAFVPPVVKHFNPNHPAGSRSPPPASATVPSRRAVPSDKPLTGKYPRDYNKGYQSNYNKDDNYRKPNYHRQDSAPYDSRGSRPPPGGDVDEAELERAKIRDEARKAQEKLEFLKEAEARLEREMSEKKGNDNKREAYQSRGPSSGDYQDSRKPYTPRDRDSRPSSPPPPPSSSRYDRGGDNDKYGDNNYRNNNYNKPYYNNNRGGYDNGRSSRGGYDNGRSSRGNRGYDNRSSNHRSNSPSRPNSPPPPGSSSKYQERRSNDRDDREPTRDLASRIGSGSQRS
ncbi:uncharacterized protein L201_001761 [Kwoniella dendrophila CBS 6074]|uniref:WW domain-containing protein n=1 Tax=Kwoniella dendrophila CBS 6074 TaxID=1295534 RepID=A0AAX4JND1_9TREE